MKSLLAIALVLSCSACGGGGNASGVANSTAQPTPNRYNYPNPNYPNNPNNPNVPNPYGLPPVISTQSLVGKWLAHCSVVAVASTTSTTRVEQSRRHEYQITQTGVVKITHMYTDSTCQNEAIEEALVTKSNMAAQGAPMGLLLLNPTTVTDEVWIPHSTQETAVLNAQHFCNLNWNLDVPASIMKTQCMIQMNQSAIFTPGKTGKSMSVKECDALQVCATRIYTRK